jgi:hypothetical protein
LQRIYADIEELVKARQKENRSEDVVEMLRNAFRLLDKLDRNRPDSGFGEPLDRSAAPTPSEDNQYVLEEPTDESSPVYYNMVGR